MNLPPEPGTAPIPEGHIRFYHVTHDENSDSIAQHGIQAERAKGDGGKGWGNEPSAGVWASTGKPFGAPSHGDKSSWLPYAQGRSALVEFHAHPSEIGPNAESPGLGEDPHEWAKHYNHVIMKGSVPPQNIVAIHRPIHTAIRSLKRYQDEGDDMSWVRNEPSEDFDVYRKAMDHLDAQRKQASFDEDEECDHEWCKGFPEGWHTKSEHMDPADRDPHSDLYHEVTPKVNDAMSHLGDEFEALDVMPHGPSHLSKKKRKKPQHAHGWGYGGLWYCGGGVCGGHSGPPATSCDSGDSGDSGGSDGGSGGGSATGALDPGKNDGLDDDRQVTYHRSVSKDLKGLDNKTRTKATDTIEKIRTNDPLTMSQTHPMTAGSALDGWSSTKISRGHRIIHRPTDDGGLEVGYVGLHDYKDAIRRLSILLPTPEHRYRELHAGGGHGFFVIHDPLRAMATVYGGEAPPPYAELVYAVDHRRKRLFVNGVHVNEEHRGKGIATYLLHTAMNAWPGYVPDPGMTTDAGEQWFLRAVMRHAD